MKQLFWWWFACVVRLLAEMNAFFASVHQAIEISLQGRPVVVGGALLE